MKTMLSTQLWNQNFRTSVTISLKNRFLPNCDDIHDIRNILEFFFSELLVTRYLLLHNYEFINDSFKITIVVDS